MSVSIYPDEGEPTLLDFIKTGLNGELKLFKNNITPSGTTVLSDLTEADFSGYAAVATDTTDYNAVSEVSNKAVLIATAYANFIHNGGGTANTIYGYYYEQDGALLQVERFDTPQLMSANADKIAIKHRITLNSEN